MVWSQVFPSLSEHDWAPFLRIKLNQSGKNLLQQHEFAPEFCGTHVYGGGQPEHVPPVVVQFPLAKYNEINKFAL